MINQVTRGNPETKQYSIVNDFSGGINTADVDERTRDNEFRELVNVELSTRGLLQNRKGWAITTDYPELSTLADENIAFMRKLDNTRLLIVSGTTNVTDTRAWTSTPETTLFNLYLYYNSGNNIAGLSEILATINNKYPATSYIAGTVIKFDNRWLDTDPLNPLNPVEVITTTYYKVVGDSPYIYIRVYDGTNLRVIKQMPGGYDGRYVLGPDVIQYVDKLVFPLNQITGQKAIVVFNIDTEKVELLDGTNDSGYLPNPYEIKNVGFNVLREDPLDVGGLQSTITNIYAVYLTDVDGNPTRVIPESGIFYLNVIYTGIESFTDWVKEFYTEDAQGNKTVVPATITQYSTSTNKVVFKVFIGRANLGSVFFSIRKEAEIEADRTFSSPTAMVNYFNPTQTTFAVEEQGGYKIYNRSTYAYTINTTFEDYVLPSLTPGQTIDLSNVSPYYYDPINKNILQVILVDGAYIIYILQMDVPTLSNLSELIPYATEIYKAGSAYYQYNGATSGDLTDFTTPTTNPTTTVDYEYIDEFRFGAVETKPLSSLFTGDVGDMRITVINDRLVLYFGNTIWFSDFNNFYYFPAFNFVSLALLANDKIQSINYFRGSWIIFTKNSIYRMSGDFGGADFSITLINDAVGCYAPRSVRSFNNTLAWLSHDGFYVLKQNFYQDGLENVEKIDKHIKGLFNLAEDVESTLYNEQVWWLFKNEENFNVLKGYYNQKAPNGVPFTTDKYSVVPTNISLLGNGLYSINAGKFYKYDTAYNDFGETYTWRVRTTNLFFGHPTHEKKFKNLYLKTKSYGILPVLFTINIDDVTRVEPKQWVVAIDSDGVMTYTQIPDAEYPVGSTLGIGSASTYDTNPVVDADGNITMENGLENDTTSTTGFTLGTNTLGEPVPQQHKLIMTLKGNTFQLIIEQTSPYLVSLQDIGFLYKLGKVRATTFNSSI